MRGTILSGHLEAAPLSVACRARNPEARGTGSSRARRPCRTRGRDSPGGGRYDPERRHRVSLLRAVVLLLWQPGRVTGGQSAAVGRGPGRTKTGQPETCGRVSATAGRGRAYGKGLLKSNARLVSLGMKQHLTAPRDLGALAVRPRIRRRLWLLDGG